ncbi:MAG: hypothetical protein ACR2NE_06700 [Pirellulales bacterium]
MLIGNERNVVEQMPSVLLNGSGDTSGIVEKKIGRNISPAWLARVLRIEWLGQTVASICWIASVLAYGISSSGDWLQLCAASSWLLANIAAALPVQAD